MRGHVSRAVIAVMALVVLSGELSAATVYTDPAAFLAAVQKSALADFEGIPAGDSAPNPYVFSDGYFNWDLSAMNGTWADTVNGSTAVMTNFESDTINFNVRPGSAPINAIGGFFFGTDMNLDIVPATISINLSDGTEVFIDTNSTDDFVGVITSSPITWATIGTDNGYITMDDLYVGNIVPLPAAAFGGVALLGMVGVARWRRKLAIR